MAEPGELDGQPTRTPIRTRRIRRRAVGYAGFARQAGALRRPAPAQGRGTFWSAPRPRGRSAESEPRRVWTVEDVIEQLRAEDQLQRLLPSSRR
jgi:hypothetical protein